MFAVIKTGGKQYKVSKNAILKLEKLDAEVGATILFEDVLATSDAQGKISLGTPFLSGMKVSAEVLEQTKDEKVIIFKKRRRQNSRRKNGHRQPITIVKIQDIGENLTAKASEKKAAPAKPAAKLEKPATPKAAKTASAELKAAKPKTAKEA